MGPPVVFHIRTSSSHDASVFELEVTDRSFVIIDRQFETSENWTRGVLKYKILKRENGGWVGVLLEREGERKW